MAWKNKDEEEMKLQINNSLSYEDYKSLHTLIDSNFSYINESDYTLLENISSQRVLEEILKNKGITLAKLADKLIEIFNTPSKDIKSLLSVISFVLTIFNVPTKVGIPTKDMSDMLSLTDVRKYMEEQNDNGFHEHALFAMQDVEEGINEE